MPSQLWDPRGPPMAQQQQHPSPGGGPPSTAHFGDTTLTKVFVGGLAWETQCETMRQYFEQFGDILEAVVIKDKNTGRSKGYGFVTFRDADAARRACADPAPFIDRRRANCNLASLGAHRPRVSLPMHGGRYRAPGSPYTGGVGAPAGGTPSYGGSPTFGQPLPFAYQQGYPYPPFGFSPYLPDYYPPNIYSPFVGPQFPAMYGGPAPLGSPTMYPHPLSPPVQGPPHQSGFGIPPHTAQQLLPYASSPGATLSNYPQFGAMVPIPAPGHSPGTMSPAAGAGRSPPPFVLPAPSPQTFTPGGGSEQQSG